MTQTRRMGTQAYKIASCAQNIRPGDTSEPGHWLLFPFVDPHGKLLNIKRLHTSTWPRTLPSRVEYEKGFWFVLSGCVGSDFDSTPTPMPNRPFRLSITVSILPIMRLSVWAVRGRNPHLLPPFITQPKVNDSSPTTYGGPAGAHTCPSAQLLARATRYAL